MGQVTTDASVWYWPTHALFKYRVQPQYSAVWYPWEFGDGTLVQDSGVVKNYDKQTMTTSPLRVPHNSFLQSGTDSGYDSSYSAAVSAGGFDSSLPSLTWTQSSGSGVSYLPIWGGQTNRSAGISVNASSFAAGNNNEFELECSISDHHAVQIELFIRPQPAVILASGAQGGTSTKTTPTEHYVGVTLDSGNAWQVVSQSNGDYLIQTFPSGASDWQPVSKIPRITSAKRADTAYDSGNGEPSISVEFRVISGRMSIKINDMGHEFSYIADYSDNNTDPSMYITGLVAGASAFMSASLYAECIKWENTSSSTSVLHSAPFSGMNFAGISPQTTIGNNDSFTHTLDTTSIDPYTGDPYTNTDGPDLRYKVDISGPTDGTYLGQPYADLTTVVRAYQMDFEGQDYFTPWPPTLIEPERIVVSHKFDPEALTVKSTAELHFNNFDGSWGSWMLNTGQVGIQIYAQSNGVESDTPVLIFTGYGHRIGQIESHEGGSTFVMYCEDRSCQLNSQRWDLPRMDGWNQYYAAWYLMQLGGVSPDDMVFNYLVPTTPFDDLGDEFGNPAPFLPIGDNGSLLNRYANGMLMDLLIKQANPIGYLISPDVNGQFLFQKFQLATGVKRVFADSDWEAPDGYSGTTSTVTRKDMTQVRSDFAIIGINSFAPYWNPIIERRPTDPGGNPIVMDPTVYNHLGYANPAQWLDGIFANEDFASNAADFMYTIFSLPGLDVNLPTSWLQPDIFPLDNIIYDGDRIVGLSSIPMVVMEVTHDISIQRSTSRIIARYLPGAPPI